MKLIVGLGNPGREYIGTRHNIGYAAVSALRKSLAPTYRWRRDERFKAEIADAMTGTEEVVLMRPLTFMNRSGESVRAFVHEERMAPPDVWVVHDDLDLPLGTLRITANAGSAGNRGVESIITALESKSFVRFRLGIGSDAAAAIPAESFVLQKFSRDERPMAELLINATVESLCFALANGIPAAANRYNNRMLVKKPQLTET